MDLGLNGRTAIVCAASQGLGKASALAGMREGVHLVIAARRREVLEGAADEIAAATGNRPKTVIADVTTAEGRDAILAACPAPDILINNAGGPPPGDFRKFERDDWIKALEGTGRDARTVERRPYRLDRLCGRSRAIHRCAQCDHQQSAARHL